MADSMWDHGSFENIAPSLGPAAEALVDAAAIKAGQHVVDVGCGSGTATLLVARPGVTVTGVDPAARLLDVARRIAAERGLQATFLPGDGAAIPLPDGSADIVLSNFGVIFAPDPAAAVAELSRVAAAAARVAFTAWVPGGPLDEVFGKAGATIARALGAPPGDGERFAWHDGETVAQLFWPHGFTVATTEHELEFSAASPQEYWATAMEQHPIAAANRQALETAGILDELHQQSVAALERVNEADDGLRFTARYAVVVADR